MFIAQIKKHAPLLILLLIYFSYILITFRAFGITWDEQVVYDRGKILYENTLDFNSGNGRLSVKETDEDVWPLYNNTYSAILYFLNKDQSYEIYHLLNFLFGTSIFIFSYLIFYKKYKKPWLSIIAPIFIILNPRFFGDLSSNPKDVPFAILFFLSVSSIYLLTDKKKILVRILILGFLFGFAQSIRSIGFSLYIILLLYDVWIWKINLSSKFEIKIFLKFLSKEFFYILSIIAVSLGFMFVTWPYLRVDFMNNFKEVMTVSSKFPWDGQVLFLGKIYLGGELPISYLPIWLLVGLPLFIIIFSIGSLILFKKLRYNEIFILSVLVIGVNFILYLLINPTIYNGLRHYLFLLPFFSVLAALFFVEIILSKKVLLKKAIFVFFVISGLLIILTQFRLFPYNYIYFNELSGGITNASKNFESDYWAASGLEALRWLENNKKEGEHRVYTCGLPLIYITYYPDNFVWVGSANEADYAFCPTGLSEYKGISGDIVYEVNRFGVPFSYVIKVKK